MAFTYHHQMLLMSAISAITLNNHGLSVLGAGNSMCPPHWLFYHEDTTCIRHLADETRSWTEAIQTCRRLSGDIIRIRNRAHSDWIRKTFYYTNNSWIGLNSLWDKTYFNWAYIGPKLGRHDFVEWAAHQPDSRKTGHHCVYQSRDHDNQWMVGNCAERLHTTCEIVDVDPCRNNNGGCHGKCQSVGKSNWDCSGSRLWSGDKESGDAFTFLVILFLMVIVVQILLILTIVVNKRLNKTLAAYHVKSQLVKKN